MSEEFSQPLDNPQHEKFAQLVAGGMDAKSAYAKTYKKTSLDGAEASGPRLLGIVRGRVKWIQEQSRTALTLTMQERREHLARATRCKLHRLDLETDGDLVQEISYDSVTGVMTKIKIPGKRECIMSDAELAGEIPDKHSNALTVNVGVQIAVLSEERRKSLIEKKRQATERRLGLRE